ncbi:hypothetical protein L1887_49887 [Cichorium endivia]|nr:hypothetical protein L1887_49887 [Cichorium endivia]
MWEAWSAGLKESYVAMFSSDEWLASRSIRRSAASAPFRAQLHRAIEKNAIRAGSAVLHEHGCETCDFAPTGGTQLVGNDAVDSCSQRLLLVVEEDACIVVEADHASVRASHLLLGTHDHRVSHIAPAHLLRRSLTRSVGDRSCFLYHHYNLVACNATHDRPKKMSVESSTRRSYTRPERRERLTDTTKTLGGLVSQHVDTFGDQTARVVDDRHACFEAQHDVRACQERGIEVIDGETASATGLVRMIRAAAC